MEKQRDFYQVSLKLFLRNKEDEVLLLKDVPSGILEGSYDFPGGRIDVDEFNIPFSEILEREAQEEIGDVKFELSQSPVALGRLETFISKERPNQKLHVLYVFFEGKYLGGDVKISPEHTGYKWLNLKKIPLDKFFKNGILEGVEMYLKNN